MNQAPRVVIIGAGIVGANLADELAVRGWTNTTVIEQGPLHLAGGSTSHAPGLVFQTNASKTMTEFASYTVEKLLSLQRGRHLLLQPGGRAGNSHHPRTPGRAQAPARIRHLLGLESRLIDPAECKRLYPLLRIRTTRCWAASEVPPTGWRPRRGRCSCFEKSTAKPGCGSWAPRPSPGSSRRAGKVTGVRIGDGGHRGGHRGFLRRVLGPRLGDMIGMRVPLLPLAHQYVITTALPELAGRNGGPNGACLPILRHQDKDLYYREHGDRIGIGSYAHRPMPVDLARLPRRRRGGDVRAPRCPRGWISPMEDFLPVLGGQPGAAAGSARARDRGRLQRDLLLHPRRRPADG